MKYLREAIKIAIRGRDDKHFHLGAVCKRADGSFVSACNLKTKIPTPSAHAESRTLRKAGMGATLFVARVMANGDWGLAKPCKECQKLIRQYRVKKVYYTVGKGRYEVWIPKMNPDLI